MDAVRVKALEEAVRHASIFGSEPPEVLIARAAAYERFLRGNDAADPDDVEEALPTETASNGPGELPCIEQQIWDSRVAPVPELDQSAGRQDRAARRALLEHAIGSELSLADFYIAGMPTWLAEASYFEMVAQLDICNSTEKEFFIKQWGAFVGGFLDHQRFIRIPYGRTAHQARRP